jgi:hypothetical protein
MPPGWDGIETIRQLWAVQPDLQIIICTAYSDQSWGHVSSLGHSDNFVILKSRLTTSRCFSSRMR